MKKTVFIGIVLLLWSSATHCFIQESQDDNQESFKVYNGTMNYIAVAPVRAKTGTDNKKAVFSNTFKKENLSLYVIPPLGSIDVAADTHSGDVRYNRVLWVAELLKPLIESIRSGNRNTFFVNALYLGSNQSGAKYIGIKNNKFTLHNSAKEAMSGIKENDQRALREAVEALKPDAYSYAYRDLLDNEDRALKEKDYVAKNKSIIDAIKKNTNLVMLP